MKRITSQEEVDRILEGASGIIFKHSTRCSISPAALSEVERFQSRHPEVPIFLVYVIEDRPLSQQLAERTGVEHESPQVIVLDRGQVKWHASHFGITESSLAANLPGDPQKGAAGGVADIAGHLQG